MSKTIIYYTDNTFEYGEILRHRIRQSAPDIPIVSVSFYPIGFGKNIVVGDIGRSIKSVFRQILIALKHCNDGIIYFCEHDNIYHSSHFDFTPPRGDVFYYNKNRWRLRFADGMASYYEGIPATSQLVCYREIALEYYEKAVRKLPKYHEPGMGKDYSRKNFASAWPNIDIRHKGTITGGDKFSLSAVSNKQKRKKFQLSEEIPYWGKTYGRVKEFIETINDK
jgi:hypothetical protein